MIIGPTKAEGAVSRNENANRVWGRLVGKVLANHVIRPPTPSAALTQSCRNPHTMAQQTGLPAQKLRVEDHPAKSVELLKSAGVDGRLWLEIVVAECGR
jgi:hypothetical protein